MEKKLPKICLTYYNLLIVQGLWQVREIHGIQEINCKYRHDGKKCETCRININICDYFLEYTNFKDDLIEYKCLCCNKSYQQKFDEKLKKGFFITYKFSNQDNNKFILLLQKGVYSYEYMDDWEKFNEISLSEKRFL